MGNNLAVCDQTVQNRASLFYFIFCVCMFDDTLTYFGFLRFNLIWFNSGLCVINLTFVLHLPSAGKLAGFGIVRKTFFQVLWKGKGTFIVRNRHLRMSATLTTYFRIFIQRHTWLYSNLFFILDTPTYNIGGSICMKPVSFIFTDWYKKRYTVTFKPS